MAWGKAEGAVAIWVVLVCIWTCDPNPSFAFGATDPNDASALYVLFRSLNSAPQLSGWKQSGDPCGESWLGITCSGSSVTAVKLSSLGLSGTLGYNMNQMASLEELDMNQNNLGNGNLIPYNLPPNLLRLDLSNNQFGGSIPYSVSHMAKLELLNLAHNQLSGRLDDIFQGLSKLTTMDLSYNSLNGTLPQSFRSLTSLTNLYLENNQFTGTINVLANLTLQSLNVANNHFNGSIPNRLKGINNLQTDNNDWSSGTDSSSQPNQSPSAQNSNTGHGSGVGVEGIAGSVAGVFFIGGLIALFIIWRKRRKNSIEENLGQDRLYAHLDSDRVKVYVAEKEMNRTSSIFDIEKLPSLPPPSLKPHHYESFDEDDCSSKLITKKVDVTSIKSTIYSVADLQIATDSFSEDNLIGEGTFGRVFKAEFDDGKILAVKKLNPKSLPSKSTGDFIDLVTNISLLRHTNLTELVGYCSEYGQRMLVYDFHKNGSLYELLHLSDEPLSWNARIKIALGAARALEYLHEVCSPSVLHKNFKSSNILLDTEFNPHLSDCGFENLIPNTEIQAGEQDMGLDAPESSMSGQYTLKSDVYRFGVVMLELMTGRKPFDSTRPRSEQYLVRWATPQLHDIEALDMMVDPVLKGSYSPKSLSRFADVIALCVQPEPEFRPPMSEVVQALVRLVQRANLSIKMGREDGVGTSRRADDFE
ncbi:protein STRUBBELIG-RECEPTOR FAMILY 7-like [Zingiber officinale]|uniref:protein STRUBBELIG-RECEPTOR FAMILY 7-like n=1 Tax=Zingiber officinale TaxID=94328 RepID=UPI001C4D028D|nr:protein STRUBBELIG-RECEPTOR FAMILY 7-like [Zingiber officinale]XP_042392667.1 protein STRUBBELIG-RECEPTOR FAMILY 7-like [Zingiber officinale]